MIWVTLEYHFKYLRINDRYFRVTSGMKNLKYLKNLKNLKKSGNFTISQEKMHEKPENLKKSGFLP